MRRLAAVTGLVIGGIGIALLLRPAVEVWLWAMAQEEAARCEADMAAQGSHCADPRWHHRRWLGE